MKKKPDWEKRKVETASLSIKKTTSLSIEPELNHFRALLGLGGYTELYKEFLLKKSNMPERDFEEFIYKSISNKTKIEKGKNSEEFRLFLSKKILENCKTKEQKERWNNYVKNKEYL